MVKVKGMSKVIVAVLAIVMVCLAVGVASAKQIRVAMVTDVGGLGDQSFNDAAYRGLQMAEKELGAKITVVESKKMDDYETNLRTLADQKFDMVWAIGFLMTDALKNVAKQYPNVKFGMIDDVVDLPNVMSVTFKEEEGSFLQGVVAGMATKSNVIGFVGGMEFPLIIKFESGFIAGVRSVNPKAKVLVAYTGKFDDPGKGKELAMAQINQKADVVYHASGACGIGVIEAAKEKGVYAIGVDSDQSHLAPKTVISSMLKEVDEGVFAGCKDVNDGKFRPKQVAMGIAEKGVGAALNAKVTISDAKFKEIKDKVEEYKGLIKNNKITVPETREDLKKFK